MHVLGEVIALWRYPCKSLGAQALESTAIESGGIPLDRSRALIVRAGHAREGKTYRGKEHNLLHLTHSLEIAIGHAADRGVAVSVEGAGRYFDAAPVSVIFDAWLDEASQRVGYALDPLRYRPNVFVKAAPNFSGPESDLVGCVLKIGEAALRVRKPIERCVTITYDQKTGRSDPSVLRAVVQHRDSYLGIYCDVAIPGQVRRGDAVTVLPQDAATVP
ncbi:MAG: hypothetical protein NVS9B12_09040 [Vulcanimicrobiaceae bacterium]